MHRQLVIEPALKAARRLLERAVETGELSHGALVHHPHLLFAPLIVGTLWNGVFSPDAPLDLEAIFETHLDVIFGAKPG